MPNFAPNTFNQTLFSTPPPPFNHSHYPQHSQFTHAMHNLNPFGGVGNLQQYVQFSPSYQGFQPLPNFGFSGGMFVGAAGGASSHGSDSSTPQTQIRELEQDEEKEDSNASSPDEGRRAMRINYTEDDNLRLVSLWIKHSVDPIHGIDQSREAYWNKIAEAFNSGLAKGARRSKGQLKNNWGRINAAVTKFNGVYGRMTYCSGESDDMLMDKARVAFKRENKKKPFTLEYVWKILRKEPKWYRNIPGMDCSEKNKRTKVDDSGAYTSSNEGETFKEVLPEGQKKAKARMRGKGKGKAIPQSPLGSQPDEDMVLFHDAMLKRASALENTTKTSKEQVRMDKIKNYMQQLDKDTSNMSPAILKLHEQLLQGLAKELFPSSDN
ncbi:unnamed protein product [Miscanthus lutarioriparius]|uniref:No apical meristem-associated C-terminal domain-containing protein n=1 Tax=Miscanthus lutarioriparius TaxID=422564 RepID=A0A811PCD7_9POAL|nr:unnamed protein product [Miscanthus lutarioriparius]